MKLGKNTESLPKNLCIISFLGGDKSIFLMVWIYTLNSQKPLAQVWSIFMFCDGLYNTKDCKKGCMSTVNNNEEDDVEEVFYSFKDQSNLKKENHNIYRIPTTKE